MSGIDDLEQNLYSRTKPFPKQKDRAEFSKKETETETSSDWNDGDIAVPKKSMWIFREGSFFKILLIGATTFFLMAVGIALYVFYGGFGVVSSQNVDIKILAPVSVGGGEEFLFDVSVENKNNVDLESADIFLEYPAGTRNADDINAELVRVSESLGHIPAGGVVRKTYRAVFFGQQEDVKNINVKIEYRIKNSNAIFSKERPYSLIISSAPVILVVEYPNEVQAGQDVDFAITLASNSRTDLTGLIMRADYPFGFSFTESSPNPQLDQNIWNLGVIKPGEKRVINIKGRLLAQENEERTFRFFVGTRSANNEKAIQNELATHAATIAVRRPSLALDVRILGSQKAEYVTSAGRQIEVVVDWFNSLPNEIRDASIEVSLNGLAYDRNSVFSSGGFYRSVDNVIVWNSDTSNLFSSLASGARGNVSFKMNTLASDFDKTPSFTFKVLMRGNQFGTSGAPEQVSTEVSRKVLLQTNTTLVSNLFYEDGPFRNTGPIPPKAENKTTYTVDWSIKNSFNDVGATEVRARLPAYVEWVGPVSPSTETLFFNTTSREVVWNVGEVKAGTGFAIPQKSAAFQISFTPSLSQVGTSPVLVDQQTLSGQDRFTGTGVSHLAVPLTTNIVGDSVFFSGAGVVVK